MGALAYATTLYTPPPTPDLGSRTERDRLSASGLKAFFAIAERWKLRDEEARGLLGGPAASTFYEMKRQPEGRILDQDRLTRISFLIGIFKALHILHGEALADVWIRMPNANPIFAGTTPLEYLLNGGLPAFQTIRRLLDARRGGL
jgi:hypothetical protein